MFKFLKEKLKQAVSKLSEDIEEKGKEEVTAKEVVKEVYEEKHLEPKKPTASDILKEIEEEKPQEEGKEEPEEKKGFFAKLKEKFTAEEKPAEPEEEKKEEKEKPVFVEKKEPEKTKEEKKVPEAPKKEEPKKEVHIPKKDKPEPVKVKEEPKPVAKKEEIIEHKKTVADIKRPEIKKEKPVEVPKKAEKKEEVKESPKEELEEKGFFAKLKEKIVTKKISESQFEDMFWEMEVILLENNVAVEVIEKIKTELKEKLVDTPIPRSSVEETIMEALRQSINDLFNVEQIDVLEKAKEKKPFVICFVGINGSGKTTTIAKMANMFKKHNMSCVLAAADTFRAAAIDQLQLHADTLGVKLIKHDYGSDAAAVAFDAIKHAKAKNIDVVLIDTAGRMHSNTNLMDEMEKIVRVAKPDLKIFIGESITGNDCTEQAKKFNETIGIDGIILSKADIDEKGGAAISVSYVTGKPIVFIGTGQGYDDLKEFDKELLLKSLDL